MFIDFRSKFVFAFLIVLTMYHVGAVNLAGQGTGSITGTVTNPENKPVNAGTGLIATGVFINLQQHGKNPSYDPGNFQTRGVFGDAENGMSRVSSNRSQGGLYTFGNLKPGLYDLVVESGVIPENNVGYTYYRPQRIVGIEVKPGQETVLNIVMHAGFRSQQSVQDPKNNTLEMFGDPKGIVAKQDVGWIEGTVTNSEGQPVWAAQGRGVSGVVITFKKTTGEVGTLQTDHFAGGFYSAFPLTGTWTVTIERGRYYGKNYSPVIITGVVIKPGVRTILNIVVNPGDALERRTAPKLEIQPQLLLGK